MKIKWDFKYSKPQSVKITHEISLDCGNGKVLTASKDNPIYGKVTHTGSKKCGNGFATYFRFVPDDFPNLAFIVNKKFVR